MRLTKVLIPEGMIQKHLQYEIELLEARGYELFGTNPYILTFCKDEPHPLQRKIDDLEKQVEELNCVLDGVEDITSLQRRYDDLKQSYDRVTQQKHDMHRERMGNVRTGETEPCVHCHKLMQAWTVTCPHCGKMNGHNR